MALFCAGCPQPSGNYPQESPAETEILHLWAEPKPHGVLLSWEEREGGRGDREPIVYHIYAGGSEKGAYALLARQIRGTSFLHTGLAKGQHQWYKVVPLNAQGMEASGALNRAVAVRGAAFGAPPPPPRVISDYPYQAGRYINISWDYIAGCDYYALDVYLLCPEPVFWGSVILEGSQIFRARNIVWDPGATGSYCFVLYGIFDADPGDLDPGDLDPRDRELLEEHISLPSDFSEPGNISELQYSKTN